MKFSSLDREKALREPPRPDLHGRRDQEPAHLHLLSPVLKSYLDLPPVGTCTGTKGEWWIFAASSTWRTALCLPYPSSKGQSHPLASPSLLCVRPPPAPLAISPCDIFFMDGI